MEGTKKRESRNDHLFPDSFPSVNSRIEEAEKMGKASPLTIEMFGKKISIENFLAMPYGIRVKYLKDMESRYPEIREKHIWLMLGIPVGSNDAVTKALNETGIQRMYKYAPTPEQVQCIKKFYNEVIRSEYINGSDADICETPGWYLHKCRFDIFKKYSEDARIGYIQRLNDLYPRIGWKLMNKAFYLDENKKFITEIYTKVGVSEFTSDKDAPAVSRFRKEILGEDVEIAKSTDIGNPDWFGKRINKDTFMNLDSDEQILYLIDMKERYPGIRPKHIMEMLGEKFISKELCAILSSAGIEAKKGMSVQDKDSMKRFYADVMSGNQDTVEELPDEDVAPDPDSSTTDAVDAKEMLVENSVSIERMPYKKFRRLDKDSQNKLINSIFKEYPHLRSRNIGLFFGCAQSTAISILKNARIKTLKHFAKVDVPDLIRFNRDFAIDDPKEKNIVDYFMHDDVEEEVVDTPEVEPKSAISNEAETETAAEAPAATESTESVSPEATAAEPTPTIDAVINNIEFSCEAEKVADLIKLLGIKGRIHITIAKEE